MENLYLNGWSTEHPVSVEATAELTRDMASTLVEYFSFYEVDGIVTIEVTNRGLWLRNPHKGGRQFLGLARLENGTGSH